MKRLSSPLILIGAALLLLLASSLVFQVDEREKAIKLFLGEITRSDYEPGLHFKMPLLERVYKFDSRILTLDSEPQRFLTNEKKNVIVDSFVKWKIADPGTFYVRLGGMQSRANNRLIQFVNKGVKDAFGRRSVQEVVASARSTLRQEIQQSVNAQAANLGIDIIDVRFKKVELPEDVRASVYQRMEKEREKIASEIRSEGDEQSKIIRAAADRRREELLATAYAQAEQTRGNGDADSARIYAEAYTKDPEFYSLYRSLNAYRNAFDGGGNVLLLKPDSEFFRYFNNPGGDGSVASKPRQ
ncbi:MAG: protease modulator HflC [Granulosicoccus sp.]|nr:protease modulator HflC [Granulosicoccus sp.]